VTWRDKLRPATFRGVPFYTESNEREGGRRTVTHEYPFSEAANFSEDLGIRSRKFNVEAYVLGGEYNVARDALIAALETPGPGELNHAEFGVVRVAVETFRVRETRTDGGMATFAISFVETLAAVTAPSVTVDAVSVATSAVLAVQAKTEELFLAKYAILPTFFEGTANGLTALGDKIAAVISGQTFGPQDVASLTVSLKVLKSKAATLARAPRDLVDTVVELLQDFASAVKDALPAPSKALVAIYALDTRAGVIATTEAQNVAAFVALVKRTALSEAATLLLTEAFAAYDDAVRARGLLTDALDEHMDSVTDDAFSALTTLRMALVNAVPGAESELPRLQSVTLKTSLPSLVTAYQLYGDVDSELALVARNRVKNPGAVSGGVPLEVLTRAR